MARVKKYTGQLFTKTSVVDYLKSEGMDSSFDARKKLAKEQGIEGYNISAEKNIELMNKLKSGSSAPSAHVDGNSSSSSLGDLGISDTPVIDNTNATFGKDSKVDNILESQYLDQADYKTESYVEKVGRETGITADIQNIDSKILETYKILGMPDQDIFSNPNMSSEEKVAASRERRNIASGRIGQLRKLQQAKQKEIGDLAQFEADKAKAKEAEYKSALAYQKELNEERKFELDYKYKSAQLGFSQAKHETDVAYKTAQLGFSQAKYETDIAYKNRQLGLSAEKAELDKLKYTDTQKKTYFKGIKNSVLLDAPDGTILKTRLDSVTNHNGGKECGEYVNDVMAGSIGRFGDSYQDKLNVANEQYGGIGAAAVWNPGNTDLGHVGVIVGEQGDNWLIKSSNLRSDGTISTDVVPKSNIEGYKNTSETKSEDDYVSYETVEDYFKDTRTKKFAKVSTEEMQKVLFDDIHNNKFKFSYKDKDGHTQVSDELTSFIKSGVLNESDIKEYKQLANANKYSSIDVDIIIPKLEKVQSREGMISVLTSLAVNGQLDGEKFDGAEEFYIGDGDGYNAIQEYFPDDVDDILKEARANADAMKEKYKIGVYDIN